MRHNNEAFAQFTVSVHGPGQPREMGRRTCRKRRCRPQWHAASSAREHIPDAKSGTAQPGEASLREHLLVKIYSTCFNKKVVPRSAALAAALPLLSRLYRMAAKHLEATAFWIGQSRSDARGLTPDIGGGGLSVALENSPCPGEPHAGRRFHACKASEFDLHVHEEFRGVALWGH